jgi:hypothetical protein
LKYRPFGKTGLNISEVVIGGGYVGGILIDPKDVIKREALRRALNSWYKLDRYSTILWKRAIRD